MNERTALYRSIVESPEDDAPRLVFADWLEENGDEKYAEIIRKQVALARLPEYHPQRTLWTREDSPQFVPVGRGDGLPAPAGCNFGEFRRGFPEDFTVLDVDPFVREVGAIFARFPVLGLRIQEREPDRISRLAEVPQLARVRRLAPNSYSLTASAEAFRAYLSLPNLAGVTDLSLASFPPAPGAIEVLNEGLPMKPRRLNLRYVLLRLPRPLECRGQFFSQLEDLRVSENSFGPTQLELMASGGVFGRLRRLVAPHSLFGDDGLRFLLGVLSSSLESLDLSNTRITVDGVRALAASPLAANLRELILRQNGLRNDAAVALSEADWPRLESLDLRDNQIRLRGFAALARATWLGRLVSLDLGNNPLTYKAADEYAKFDAFRRIGQISLKGCNLREEGVMRVLRCEDIAHRVMFLGNNRLVGRRDLGQLLLDSNHFSRVEFLSLGADAVWNYLSEAIQLKYAGRVVC